VQVALTVMVPGDAPAVVSVATLPLPETLPPLELQPETVTGTPSGLVHVQVTVTGVPACPLAGLAEQLIVGGFFGGSFTA
jgi:hypothetical protein